jgi:hypothetical protein
MGQTAMLLAGAGVGAGLVIVAVSLMRPHPALAATEDRPVGPRR